MHIVNFYSVKLVKESASRYDIPATVNSPSKAYDVLKILNLQEESEEVVVVITLNTHKKVTGVFEAARGTVSEASVHPREIFKRAILNNASSIILAHNHPGGGTEPSVYDIAVTKKIKAAGDIIGIELIDHIIVTEDGYTSILEKMGGSFGSEE